MKHFTLYLAAFLLAFMPMTIWAQGGNTETQVFASTFTGNVYGVAHETYSEGTLTTVEGKDWKWDGEGENKNPIFQMTEVDGQSCLSVKLRTTTFKMNSDFAIPGIIKKIIFTVGGNVGSIQFGFGEIAYRYNLNVPESGLETFPISYDDNEIIMSKNNNQEIFVTLFPKVEGSSAPMYIQSITFETEVEKAGENDIVSVLEHYDSYSHTLLANDEVHNWKFALPADSTQVAVYDANYSGTPCILMQLTGGTSTYSRLTFYSDFPVVGKVKKIIVRAAGNIPFILYTKDNGETVQSQIASSTVPYFDDYNLDFGSGIQMNDILRFHLYAERYLYLQSITIVMEGPEIGDESTITSTFTMLMQDAPIDENTQHGIVGTEEGFIWDLFVQGQSTLMSATNLSFDGETMIPCLLVGNPASSEETVFHIKNQFSLKGPVSKVVIRATGQIENIEAILCEKQTGDSRQQVQTALGNYKDGFMEYNLLFDGTMEYQDGTLDIYFSGSGGIFVNSITIFQGEGGEESEFSGKCGDNLYYTITPLPYNVYVWDYETYQSVEAPAYKLTITGTGDMYDYGWDENRAPWMEEYQENIAEIELPEGLTRVGNEAFDGCNNARIDRLPSTLKSIGFYAFSSMYWFTSDLHLPEGLTAIESRAFCYTSGIQNLYLPSTVTYIGDAALSGLWGLENFYVDEANTAYKSDGNAVIETATGILIAGNKNTVIPNYVKVIGTAAFYGVRADEIPIPSSVVKIGSDAFGNSYITKLDIPANVKVIGNYAFYSCSKLLNVTIGSGAKQIGSNPFYYSTNILDINCYARIDSLEWKQGSYENNSFKPDKMTKMHVRAADLEKWQEKFSFLNVTFVPDLSASIIPITEEMEVRASFFDGVNLYDTSLGNVYYNLNPSTGNGYTDGYIFITQTTDMSQINDAIPGSSDIRDKFTGIILEVGPGEGVIALDVATKGNISLVVQIGDGTPTYAVRNERGEVFVSYNVSEPTYVYFYAVDSSASLVRALGNAEEDLYDNVLLIYGFSVYPGADETGIKSLTPNPTPVDEGSIYDLSGRRVEGLPAKKGIYIVNGKKVSFK